MTVEELKAWLAENLAWFKENAEDEEVQGVFSELKEAGVIKLDEPQEPELTPEKVHEFVSTNEGREVIQPIIDREVTKAVKTRDNYHNDRIEKEVKKRVAAEVLKMNPEEEPWQKEMRELREEMERKDAAMQRAEMRRKLVEEASKIGVDPFFIEDIEFESFEQGQLFIQNVKKREDKLKEDAINSVMADDSYKPGSGNDRDQDGKKKSIEDLSKMSRDEIIEMEMRGELDSALTE